VFAGPTDRFARLAMVSCDGQVCRASDDDRDRMEKDNRMPYGGLAEGKNVDDVIA
jgi:hypothetical protein